METAIEGANPALWVWFKLSWNLPDKGWLVPRLYEELEDGGDTIRCVDKPEYEDKFVDGDMLYIQIKKVKGENNDTTVTSTVHV